MGITQAAIVLFVIGIGADRPAIENPSFEAPSPSEGWQVVTYGAKAEVVADDHEPSDGRQSLRSLGDGAVRHGLGAGCRLEAVALVSVQRVGADPGARAG